MLNPYWDEIKDWYDDWHAYERGVDRRVLVVKYAWAIPTVEVIRQLAEIAPRMVEIGAGTGYWATMLACAKVDIIAYDKAARGDNFYGHRPTWFDVKSGGVVEAAHHSDRALLLCWPPYAKPMAYLAAKCYKGDTLIYIGEGGYGCTADESFHDLLEREWTLDQELVIPQWSGIHDSVYVYKR